MDYLNEFLRVELDEAKKKTGKNYRIEYVPSANIPLITITISPPRQPSRGDRRRDDKEDKENIKIDILVNNLLGVINSKFLKVYSEVKWIRNLVLLVKMWGKANGIISKNQLSSYSMVLLLLSFLLRTKRIKLIIDARSRTKNLPHFQYKRMKKGEE